jgi:hypothetical protein
MNTVQFHARYTDGAAYKVIYDPLDKQTYLATTDGGRIVVPFYLNGATFAEFYFTGFAGMMGKDAWGERAKMDRLLTPPAKPANPPPAQVQDERLHIERLPGESGFAALQRAWAEQRLAQYRRSRNQARLDIQSNAVVDTAKISAARDANNRAAAIMRPSRRREEE